MRGLSDYRHLSWGSNIGADARPVVQSLANPSLSTIASRNPARHGSTGVYWLVQYPNL
jgi:hypothetical protein